MTLSPLYTTCSIIYCDTIYIGHYLPIQLYLPHIQHSIIYVTLSSLSSTIVSIFSTFPKSWTVVPIMRYYLLHLSISWTVVSIVWYYFFHDYTVHSIFFFGCCIYCLTVVSLILYVHMINV